MSYYTEATIDVFNTIMSAASGVTDIVGTVKRSKNTAGYLNRSSIMKASKDLVMSFPVICPNTVTPATANMIVKAIERNCVTTLQLLFSAANLRGMNGMDVIQKWHKNMDNRFDMDDFLDAADAVSFTFESDDALARFATKFATEMIREVAANRNVYPENDFAEQGINRFAVTESSNGTVSISEALHRTFNGNHVVTAVINPALNGPENLTARERIQRLQDFPDKPDFDAAVEYERLMNDIAKGEEVARANAAKEEIDRARLANDQIATQAQIDRNNELNNQYELDRQDKLNWQAQQQDNWEKEHKLNRARTASQIARNNMQNQVDQTNLFHQQLLSSDVRKCNELVPSMMIIRFNAEIDDGKYEAQQFIAGVKARLITCSSMEIIDAIRATVRSKVNLLNLVRATTKEISFCRDFVAAVDQAKIDAKRNSNLSKTSPIWRSLQWRSSKSVMNRLRRHKPNDAGAITTLVLTSEEVNYMKSEYNIDLNVPNKVREIMEAYNLMCFCIVDEEVEVVRFLFDGEKYFQDYSFQSLEKETGDSSYKKVINLMSKISR